MRWLRSWLWYLYVAVTVIPVGTLCLLFWPFASRHWRYQNLALPWCRSMMRMLNRLCGINVNVLGLENLPTDTDRPVVLLAKHQSAWETLFIPTVLPRDVGFVYKESLHWIPFLGWALKSFKMIAINRSQGRSAYAHFLERGQEFIKTNSWVLLFPEGTRTKPGAKTQYKSGGARFACQVDALVIPVALNSGRVWPRNQISKAPGTITLSFGPAIDATGADPKQLTAQVQDWIETEIVRFENQS